MRQAAIVLGITFLSLSFTVSANAAPAACSAAQLAKIREKAVEGNEVVKINCNATLAANDVITKRVVFEGPAASGAVLDCKGAKLTMAKGDALVVQSKQVVDANGVRSWQRPEDIIIKNCEVRGGIRIRGMAPNGEGEFLRESSRLDDKHGARARAAAPTRITLDKLTIIGADRIPLYVAPGSTYVTLKNSKVDGKSGSVAIYLDTESSNNVIQNNNISVETETRELFAVDGSAKNIISGNRFSGLSHGGIYLYRNCGEGGTVRHQGPQQNQIINNVFYYKNYNGGNPSVFLASRNGNRSYCNDDSGYPWGSSANNNDLARNNVVAENQIYVLDPAVMIRDNDKDNHIIGNVKVKEAVSKASSCYLFAEARLLADGKSSVSVKGEGRDQVCNKVSCNDGLLVDDGKVACPVAKVVDFSCKISGKNAGCDKTVSCPSGYRIQDAKASCDLEMDSVSDNMNSLAWNRLEVERASDSERDGACSMGEAKISSGGVALNLRGLQSVKVHCHEQDKNGGDCEIKGQLRCVP